MTFNVRRPMPHLNRRSPDVWLRRRPALMSLLATERPTVLGVQEALPDQLAAVAVSLGAEYRWVGGARSGGGRGEHCAVFYHTRRLRLLQWHQQALSDTPGVPGSATWGNWLPRTVVGAVFEDRETGTEIFTLTTHLDHLSARSRLRSAEAIREIVSSGGRPTILLGDFNTGLASGPYRALTAGQVLSEAWSVARERLTEEWGTFPRYRAPRREGERIDWILTSASIEVLQAAVNVSRPAGTWPSDHAPVQAAVRCPSR